MKFSFFILIFKLSLSNNLFFVQLLNIQFLFLTTIHEHQDNIHWKVSTSFQSYILMNFQAKKWKSFLFNFVVLDFSKVINTIIKYSLVLQKFFSNAQFDNLCKKDWGDSIHKFNRICSCPTGQNSTILCFFSMKMSFRIRSFETIILLFE